MSTDNGGDATAGRQARPGWRGRWGRAHGRRFGRYAALATAAAVTMMTVGGVALASATAPVKIKACYKSGSGASALEHVAATAACPTGYTGVTWNQAGPAGPAGATGPAGAQGPAGLATGLAGSNTTETALNSAGTYQTVLQTPDVTVTGTYYVTASVTVFVAAGDAVSCVIGGQNTNNAAVVGYTPSDQVYAIPVVAYGLFQQGEDPTVECTDVNSTSGSNYYSGAMTATLVTDSSSLGGTLHTIHHGQATAGPVLPPNPLRPGRADRTTRP